MMFCSDDALFADDGAVGVGDGDGDVTDTEEAYTLRCEAAAQRALGSVWIRNWKFLKLQLRFCPDFSSVKNLRVTFTPIAAA